MDFIRQSVAITFVLLLLWAALWMLRRRRLGSALIHPGRPTLIQSCAKLALTTQHAIHLIRIGDRQIVVGVHPSGLSFLCDVSRSTTPEGSREEQA